MKNIIKNFFVAVLLITAGTACDKRQDLQIYQSATPAVLTASAATIAPLPADSNKTALTLSWTYPNHAATDSNSIKYEVEIDSSGKNFANSYSRVLNGSLSTSFTAKELNDILLAKGYAFNIAVGMDVRVTSSYANNNERISSNTLKLMITPYKVPPKIALPTTGKLYIVGDATDFDWTNPTTMTAVRELTRLEETKWGGIFHLSGAGGYLLLPIAGNWDSKFSVSNSSAKADGGDFGFNLPDNFPGNVSGGGGWYMLVLDFQTGKYTVTKVDNPLPADLYITGDATPSGWVNNPPASQHFTPVTNGVFELSMSFTATGAYKFLSNSGQWQPQFGGTSATGGALGANYGTGSDPSNIPAPSVAGNYKIRVNFITNSYNVTKL